MNYENFKRKVEEEFINYLPDEMKHMEVKFHQVNKINRTLDGISVIHENTQGSIGPTIYINDMYEVYQNCRNFEKTMSRAIFQMSHAQVDLEISLNRSTSKDNIIFQVVNTEQNRKILDQMPNRSFLDLSIIYRWIIQIDENDIKSVMITNDLANSLGLTEYELFKCAEKNTRRIFPPVVRNMNDCLQDLVSEFGLIPKSKILSNNMYVITNTRCFYGANTILCENELRDLAEKLKSDLYILPSSLHEVIAVIAMGDPYELADMVTAINMKEVSLEERLSNQVYHYDRNLRKLFLATDTPNKNLEM